MDFFAAVQPPGLRLPIDSGRSLTHSSDHLPLRYVILSPLLKESGEASHSRDVEESLSGCG
jgi:hypothetical protein